MGAIGTVLGATPTSQSSQCEMWVAMMSFKRYAKHLARRLPSTLLSMERATRSASPGSMRHAASQSSSSQLLIVERPFEFLVLPHRQDVATWRIGVQRQTVMLIASQLGS